MATTVPLPTAFISYSAGEPFSAILKEAARVVLESARFQVLSYRNEHGEASMANVDQDFAESSLSHVDEADLVVAIHVPYHYGFSPRAGQCEGADGRKSLCQLEIERAWKTGKTVIVMIPQAEWVSARFLAPEELEAVGRGYSRLATLSPEVREALQDLQLVLRERSCTEFTGLENFREQLKRAIDKWCRTRLIGVSLYREPSGQLDERADLRSVVVDRLLAPGVYGLFGGPGVGKSEFAARVAAELAAKQAFRRIVSIDCRAGDSTELAEELLRETGTSLDPEVSGRSELKAQLESWLGGSANLVVLDNVGEPSVLDLIPGGESTTLVVTSDARVLAALGIPKEARFELPRLEAKQGRHMLRERIGAQRADAEPEAFESLCDELLGWPLGLDLAGSSIVEDEISPEPIRSLLARLRERGIKALDAPDALGRLAVGVLAVERLPAETRSILAAAVALPSVHFSREVLARAAQVGLLELDTELGRLLAMSLLGRASDGRLWLQPEARLYVGQDEGIRTEAMQISRRLDADYLERIERLARNELGVLDEPDWDAEVALEIALRNIEQVADRRALLLGAREIANRTGDWQRQHRLVAALRLRSAGEDVERDGLLLLRSGQLNLHRGRWAAARGELERATEIFRETGNRAQLARALTSLAKAMAHQRGKQGAIPVLDEALEIERSLSPRGRGVAFVLHSLGRVHLARRSFDRASECLAQSIEIGERLGDVRHLSKVHTTRAQLFLDTDRVQEALTELECARELAERDRNQRQVALTLLLTGDALRELDRNGEAIEKYREAAQIADRLADRFFRWSVQFRLGQALYRVGQGEAGREALAASLSEVEGFRPGLQSLWALIEAYQEGQDGNVVDLLARLFELDSQFGGELESATLYNVIAGLLRDQGEIDGAIRANRRALELSRDLGTGRGISITIQELAKSLVAAGRREEAIEILEGRLGEAGLDPVDRCRMYNTVGSLYADANDFDRAIDRIRRSAEIEKSLGHSEDVQMAFPLLSLGNVLRRAGRPQEALPHLEEAARLEREYGTPLGEAMVHHALAQAHMRLQDLVQAEAAALQSVKIRTNSPFHTAVVQRTLGRIYRLRKELGKAEEVWRQSIALARSHGLRRHLSLCLGDLGDLLATEGRAQEAMDVLREGLAEGDEAALTTRLFLHRRLAGVLLEEARVDEAFDVYRRGCELVREKDLRLAEREYQKLLVEFTSSLRDFDREGEVEVIWEEVLVRSAANEVWSLHYFALRQVAGLRRDAHRYAQVEDLYRRALALYRERHQPRYFQHVACDFSRLRARAQGWTAGVQLLSRLLDEEVLSNAPADLRFWPTLHLSQLQLDAKDFAAAQVSVQNAIHLAQEADRPDLEGRARLVLARVFLQVGREEEALQLVISEYERTQDEDQDSSDAVQLGRLLRRIDPKKAEQVLLRTWEECRRTGWVPGLVNAAREICRIRVEGRRFEEAEELLVATESVAAAVGATASRASVWQDLGRLYRRIRGPKHPRGALERAVELREEAGDPFWLVSALRSLVAELRRLKLHEEALVHVRKILASVELIRSSRYRSKARVQAAAVLKDMDLLAEAEDVARRACDDAELSDDSHQLGSALLTLGAVLARSERGAEARSTLRRAREELQHQRESETYAFVLAALAAELHRARRGPEEVQLLEEKLEMDAQLGRPLADVLFARSRLANSQRISGRLVEGYRVVTAALRDFEEALEQRQLMPGRDADRLRHSLGSILATVAFDMNRVAEAREFYSASVQASDRPDYWSLQGLAKVEALAGRADVAMRLFERAAKVVRGTARARMIHWQDRGFSLVRLGRFEAALSAFEECQRQCSLIRERGDRLLSEAFLLSKQPLALLGLGRIEEATTAAERAREIAREIRILEVQVAASTCCARVHLQARRYELALACCEEALECLSMGKEGPFRQVTLQSLAAASLLGLGRTEEAAERQRMVDDLKAAAIAGGVQFTPYELGAALPTPVQSEEQEGESALDPAGSSPVRGVVREVGPEGLGVELADGRKGFCPRESFVAGGAGTDDLSPVRGEEFTFHAQIGAETPAGAVPLTRAGWILSRVRELRGRVAEVEGAGRAGPDSIAVTLAPGVQTRMNPYRDIGWGKFEFFRPLELPGVRLRVRLEGSEGGVPRVSAKQLYRAGLEQRDPGIVFQGRVVEVFGGGTFVQLAPGVVGLCPRDLENVGPARPLRPGLPVSVCVDELDDRRILLNRARALESQLERAEGRCVKGYVERVERAYALIEIAPGLLGLLHQSQFSDRQVSSLTEELRLDEEIVVRVLSARRANGRFEIALSSRGASGVPAPLESGVELLDLLPRPDVDLRRELG